MDADRRKLAADWRRAMRRSDDESASPLLNSWIIRGGNSKLTYGGLGALGGAIRKLGMVRAGLIVLGLCMVEVAAAKLGRVTGFPAAYGVHCHWRQCGLAVYVYSPRLLTHGTAAEIALFIAIWLPLAAVAALLAFAFRRRSHHSKPE